MPIFSWVLDPNKFDLVRISGDKSESVEVEVLIETGENFSLLGDCSIAGLHSTKL